MHLDLLFNEIMRGTWFITEEQAFSNQSLVIALLTRNTAIFDQAEKPTKNISYIDMNGQALENSESAGSKGAVAIIPLKGTMLKYGGMCSYGMQDIANMMIEAAQQKDVVGIITDGDSGGGAINSIPPLEQAKAYIKTVLNKPIVGHYDICGSACYYQACSDDYIFLNNELCSAAGSIGVMTSWLDFKEYYEKAGVHVNEFYSDLSFNKNKDYRNAREEEGKGIINNQLNPLAKGFQERVKEARGTKLNWEGDDRVLSGSMFKGMESIEKGLVDAIGTLEDAVQKVYELADNKLVNSFINSK